jgi:hypothetical protein
MTEFKGWGSANQDYSLDEGNDEPYDTSNDEVPDEVYEMTIGIGLLCEGGQTAVLASDMRTTYGATLARHSDRGGKQYDFPPYLLAGATAGKVSVNHAIISEFTECLRGLLTAKREQPGRIIVLEHITQSIDFARKKKLRELQDCAVNVEIGAPLQFWLKGRSPNGPLGNSAFVNGLAALRRVRDELRKDLGLIVVGWVDNSPIFVKAIGAEPLTESASPPIYVIGSGRFEALNALNGREQDIEMTLARSLFHVYEALKAARKEKTVGPPDWYMVIRRDAVMRFNCEAPLLREWHKAYKKRLNTASLDKRLPNEQASMLLIKHGPSRRFRPSNHETLMLEPTPCGVAYPKTSPDGSGD